jgi:hypothetical protein
MKELLKEVLEYIEMMEVEADAEWGAGRDWEQLKGQGGMTKDGVRLYEEIEREIHNVSN